MVSFSGTQTEQGIGTSESRLPSDAPEVNVGMSERLALGTLGGLLAASAISKPTLPRLILGAIGGGLIYRSLSGHCPVYEKLGMDTSRSGAAQPHDYYRNGIHASMAYTIMRPAQELFDFWRNFENLPRFMYHLEAVRKLDDRRSHWVAKGPAGYSVEWDAEIINEEPGRLIAWRSLENADVDNSGSVRFVSAPGNRGTEVRVEIEYIPPAGQLGKMVARLFGKEPRQQIQEDLRRFKRLMETGEIPSTEGQPRGSCGMSQ